MNTTFQKPWIRVVTTVLAVALMAGIFLFSHQGKASETTSELLMTWITSPGSRLPVR